MLSVVETSFCHADQCGGILQISRQARNDTPPAIAVLRWFAKRRDKAAYSNAAPTFAKQRRNT